MTYDLDQSLLELLQSEDDPHIRDRLAILWCIGRNVNDNTEAVNKLLKTISREKYDRGSS